MTKIESTRPLGASGLTVSSLGVGTNKWQYGKNDQTVEEAFKAAVGAGITFFDTAEGYGMGKSEQLLGKCLQQTDKPVTTATKYFPFLFRSMDKALDASLKRLGVKSVDLFFIHFPLGNIEKLMDQMAKAFENGKIRAVGVSNFSAEQMRQAANRLARYNIPLAANEVQYNLLDRKAEINGVLNACRELNVALVAYRPLSGGRLTVKQTQATDAHSAADSQSGKNPEPRDLNWVLQNIADRHGKSVSQVTLNWLLRRDEHIIPIPGATKAKHLLNNAETLNWEMSEEEFAMIDMASTPANK